jgi:hypothetical protein
MMNKLDNIEIQRTDNGWLVRINGENECGEWADESMVVVGDDSDPILTFLDAYITLPRRK